MMRIIEHNAVRILPLALQLRKYLKKSPVAILKLVSRVPCDKRHILEINGIIGVLPPNCLFKTYAFLLGTMVYFQNGELGLVEKGLNT